MFLAGFIIALCIGFNPLHVRLSDPNPPANDSHWKASQSQASALEERILEVIVEPEASTERITRRRAELLSEFCKIWTGGGRLSVENAPPPLHLELIEWLQFVLEDHECQKLLTRSVVDVVGIYAGDSTLKLNRANCEVSLTLTDCNLRYMQIEHSRLASLGIKDCRFSSYGVVVAQSSIDTIAVDGMSTNSSPPSWGARHNANRGLLITDSDCIRTSVVRADSITLTFRGSTFSRYLEIGASDLRVQHQSDEFALLASHCDIGHFGLRDSTVVGQVFISGCNISRYAFVENSRLSPGPYPTQYQVIPTTDVALMFFGGETTQLSIGRCDVNGDVYIHSTSGSGELSITSCASDANPKPMLWVANSSFKALEEGNNRCFSRYRLSSLEYERLVLGLHDQESNRIDRWFAEYEDRPFDPDQYTLLASEYSRVGYDHLALRTVILREEHRWQHLESPSIGDFIWHQLIRRPIGYGYKPGNALIGLLLLWGLGSVVFWLSRTGSLFREVHPLTPNDEYGTQLRIAELLHPIAYSFDTLAPILSLSQANRWVPDPRRGGTIALNIRWGALAQWYYWFHHVSGWVLSTLFVLAITGIFKQV